MYYIAKIIKGVLLIISGLFIAILLNEMYLRAFKPFDIRVKGGNIVLPVNRKYIIHNNATDKLDETIIHKKNSIGFRGIEPPDNFKSYFKIITIGGSTTECFNQSDGKTWSDILGNLLRKKYTKMWINNAGLDGNSTFGHLILMQDYIIKLKPQMVLFLIGLNDIGKYGIGEFDRENIKNGISFHSLKSFIKTIGAYLDVISILNNKYRSIRDKFQGTQKDPINFDKLKYIEIKNTVRKEKINIQIREFLPFYKKRIEKLIELSKSNGIEPIFITQPAIYGNGIDNVTGKDLSKISVGKLNGGLAWDLLETYNNALKEIGEKNNVHIIDLATKMPKNSTYYYDFVHFSNEGSKIAANIIYRDLIKYFAKNMKFFKINN